MASHSLKPRRAPQQKRGRQRVAALLDAAASVIADVGYEAATMSAIAERADACIGSLYQFFPNKPSITQALRSHYARQFEALLARLEAESSALSLDSLVNRLVDAMIEFVESHPAFLPLLDAPISTRSPAVIRKQLRKRVVGLLSSRMRRRSKISSMQLAAVTLQIIKAFNQLYAEAQPDEKQAFIQEFKVVLFCYLNARIGTERVQSGRLP